LKGDDDCTAYYDLLGVAKDADTNEIRKAYKKKSLEYHPDKLAQRGKTLTPEDQAQFQRIKEAHDALIDPQKRALYDEVGEKGMKWTEDPMSLDPDQLTKNFMRSKKSDRLSIVLIALILVLIPILLPLLFNLKADGIAKGPWTSLATPLWIVDIVVLGLLSISLKMAIFKPPPPEGMSEDDPEYQEMTKQFKVLPSIFGLIRFIFLIVFELMVSLELDNYIHVPIPAMFVFLFIWEIMGASLLVPAAFQKIDNLDYSDDENIDQQTSTQALKMEEKIEARSGLFMTFVRIWLEIFIVLKLSGAMPANWWLVLMPVWFVVLSGCCSGFLVLCKAQELAKDLPMDEESPRLQDPEIRVKAEAVQHMYVHVISNWCSCFCIFFVLVLTASRLQNKAFSTFFIFLPMYIVAGLIFCCLCCVIMCANEPKEQEIGQGSYTPPEVALAAEFSKAVGQEISPEDVNYKTNPDGSATFTFTLVPTSTVDKKKDDTAETENEMSASAPLNATSSQPRAQSPQALSSTPAMDVDID